MNSPSKEWKEEIASDEAERFEKYAQTFKKIQSIQSKKFGTGRALHRKKILSSIASLEIFDAIPNEAKFGLFSKPGNYKVHLRLSNGSMKIQSDSMGDIRGFAIKVIGLDGESALGGRADSQSFLLINQESFSSPKSKEFVELVFALSDGPISLLSYLFKTYGLMGTVQKMAQVGKTLGKPFTGFATEKFYSAVPISCGPYAIKVRISPNADEPTNKVTDFRSDLKERLEKRNIEFDFQIQFFINETLTPIEDASKVWNESDSPFITVGKLVIPKFSFDTEEHKKLEEEIEKNYLDPWNSLKEHRPLGDIMRARKYAYYASQSNRK
ncbi:MAG: catalase [Leptospiraceae bacterium]|nr:catalase [Leptospiraceae bacterium]